MKKAIFATLAAILWFLTPSTIELEAQLFGGGALTHVANKTALLQTPGAAARIFRDGFYAAGDGGDATYTWFAATCSLNAGSGDGGSQVPAAGGGCWIADFSGKQASPLVWGAKGDGTTDDTTAVQASINGAAASGATLIFDGAHLFKINSTLNITSSLRIEGQYRYGAWTTNAAGTGVSCPFGLVTPNTGITMINASAVTGSIKGLCIDMTGNDNNSATAGTAIQLAPPSATTYQTGFHVELNTILGPFNGITLDGFGYSAGCCGEGATADGNAIVRNTIVNPLNVGIRVGLNTAGAASPGNTVTDNTIVCKNTSSKASGIGIALYDGAIWYDGTQNGPEGCHVGTMIAPGAVSGHAQNAQFSGDGVFGDQSGLHDLLVQPQAGGVVSSLNIGGKQPWASATGNINSVLIDCTNATASCSEFSIANGTFHGGNGQNQPIVDIEGGTGGPFDVSLTGNNICQAGTPVAGAVALKLNAGSGPTGRWTVVGNRLGTGCFGGSADPVGLSLTINSGSTPKGDVTIIGNDISIAATPISYAPNPADNVIIHDNMGIDNLLPSIADAATIDPGLYPTILLTGSGTAVTSITRGHANARLEIITLAAAVSFATGGTANQALCNAVSSSGAFGRISLQYIAGTSNCWDAK